MFTEKSFSTFTIYINYSHWHQCLYCVLFLWEETRAPMRFMCVSHDRFEEMSKPRYLAENTDSS